MPVKPYWDVLRPSSSLNILLQCAGDYGLGSERCLSGSGIEEDSLLAPQAHIYGRQELHVIRNILAELGPGTPLALEVGCRQHATTFGMLGFAILSSQNLQEAMQLFLRHIRMTSSYSRITPASGNGEALLRADNSQLPADVRNFLVERELATLITLERDLAPLDMRAQAVRFQFPEPSYAHRVEGILGIVPEYDFPTNECAFPVEMLKMPLSQSNPATRQACEEECRRLLQTMSDRSGLASQVRDRLVNSASLFPSMQSLADDMNIHPKTLRRRLAKEGVIFSDLLEEVRRAIAEELLANTELSHEEISVRLGYSETSAFSRAFKRWNSVSPRQFRRDLRAKEH
ncbi:AraC family transcriptional regulator [Alcanivorax sp. DP30]|uniref:AraC family transcriptional regulator n=1 Tax=Alcanivorax sp. DP30 TaxID=2606217 RepID=UPI0013719F27|nr:AraC family transcriptional regulator [Alcanivorax sp. DP30]MZR63902.1 helix-turn-helix domain-containing protein [Alcanivorax sp. DP30]